MLPPEPHVHSSYAAVFAAAVPDLALRTFDPLDAIAKVEAMRREGRPHSGHG